DEDGELELTAALHLPGVWALGRQHADADVADQLRVQPRLQQPGRELRALLAGERRGVHTDRHAQAGLVDEDHRQRPRIVDVGQRLANGDIGQPGDGDDLAGAGLGRVDAVEGLGDVQLGDLHLLDAAV